jgi:tRNA (guanine9-N1)-methyltransferase
MIRLTKQEKKLKKFKYMQETRKEKRKRAHIQKRRKRSQMLEIMTEDQRREFIQAERLEEEALKKELERVSEHGIPLVFDLSYCNLMSSVELGSLQSQISDSVGFLRKQAPQYFKLMCSNSNEEITQKLFKRGAKKWQVSVFQDDLLEIKELSHRKIVYLSPDAHECLETVDQDSAYVIGGLVDKTIQSKISLNRANDLAVAVKRLPTKEYASDIVKPERRVFNINTVVQVLHWMAAGIPIKEALLTSIPKRWIKDPQGLQSAPSPEQII